MNGPPPERSFADTASSMDVRSYNESEPFSRDMTRTDLVFGVGTLLLWVAFFTMGLLVPTSQMRSALWSGGTGSVWTTIGYVLLIGAGYTLTNILFLACFAALLGGMAHRWQIGDGVKDIPDDSACVAPARTYMSAVIRGFFMYLMFISGFLLVSTESTVVATEFSQYIRIAGMISIVAFVVGFDPNLLIRFMRRILSLANLPAETPRESPAAPQESGQAAPVSFKPLPR